MSCRLSGVTLVLIVCGVFDLDPLDVQREAARFGGYRR